MSSIVYFWQSWLHLVQGSLRALRTDSLRAMVYLGYDEGFKFAHEHLSGACGREVTIEKTIRLIVYSMLVDFEQSFLVVGAGVLLKPGLEIAGVPKPKHIVVGTVFPDRAV